MNQATIVWLFVNPLESEKLRSVSMYQASATLPLCWGLSARAGRKSGERDWHDERAKQLLHMRVLWQHDYRPRDGRNRQRRVMCCHDDIPFSVGEYSKPSDALTKYYEH